MIRVLKIYVNLVSINLNDLRLVPVDYGAAARAAHPRRREAAPGEGLARAPAGRAQCQAQLMRRRPAVTVKTALITALVVGGAGSD